MKLKSKNTSGLLKSGVIFANCPKEAHTEASRKATTFSDDVFVVCKLERIE